MFRLNNLDNQEYVHVVSSLLCAYEKRFDYSNDKTRRRNELVNSKDKIAEKPIFEVEDLAFYTCPSNFYSWDFGYWMELESQYKEHGNLPFEGLIKDQPAKVMQLFKLIRRFISDKEVENMKKQQRELQQKYGR